MSSVLGYGLGFGKAPRLGRLSGPGADSRWSPPRWPPRPSFRTLNMIKRWKEKIVRESIVIKYRWIRDYLIT